MLGEGDVLAGRYRLRTRLGGGGMAAVWLADDLELGRRVAAKLVAPGADRARFEREARAYAACAHPNVARVFDYGGAGDQPHIVLEYVPGGTLEDLLRNDAPLAIGDATRIAGEIAAGIAHAHARGLVHRDLKPSNIMFDDEGRTKIVDFGIARLTGASTLTETGTILGTAVYLSPEQGRGEPATPASDVYAFGVILFQMLAGRPPFESSNVVELVTKHAREIAPAVSRFREDAPQRLVALIARSLAKEPDQRPRDGAELVAALSGDASEPVTAVLPRADRRPRRRAAFALVVAIVLVVAAAGFAAALLTTGGSEEPSPARAGTVDTGTAGSSPAEPPPAPETSRATGPSRPTSTRTTAPPPAVPPPQAEEPTTEPTTVTSAPATETTTTAPTATTTTAG